MSLAKHSKPGAEQLPKSVKVRSTCNACQQAKIRCSHEKPSCRRCQKRKIDCIYSVSRRLGRPAKKREQRSSEQDRGISTEEEAEECAQRPKKQTRKKSRGANLTTKQRPRATRSVENEIQEDRCETPAHPKGTEKIDSQAADVEFASKHWLQELSAQVDWDCKIAFEQTYGADDLVDSLELSSDSPSILDQASAYEGVAENFSALSAGWDSSFLNQMPEDGVFTFQRSVAIGQQDLPVSAESSAMPWLHAVQGEFDAASFHDPWANDRVMPADVLIDPVDQWTQIQMIEQRHKSEVDSPLGSSIILGGVSDLGCDCYKYAMGELLRSGTKCDMNGICSIDNILASQKELLRQTEAILSCKLCSQSETQANMLMVIVVTVDSLLTSLDTTASSAKTLTHDRPSAGQPMRLAKEKTCTTGFKSQIDGCPLQIGEFHVPADEKAWFIRQAFQARLSNLLGTIRRIRLYMQQHLPAALSRGRLMMIMETDRRLQLILMKVKMAIG